MKKFKIFVFSLSLALITSLCVAFINPNVTSYAVDTMDEVCLTISGTHSTTIKADTAEVHAVVESVGQDASMVKEDIFSQFEHIKNVLIDVGADEHQTNITYFNINANQNCSVSSNSISYYAVLNYSFTTNDMDNLDSVLNSLLDNGTKSISYINFSSTKSYETYQQSLNQALNIATENAKNILGKNNIQIYKIKEKSCYYSPVQYRNYADISNINQDIEITASVEIVCS